MTELMVIDNLKSGVSKACRYEPDTNPTYQEMAAPYGTAVLPARVRKPRDKAEVGVQLVERWILATLRRKSFFSLIELNQAIRGLRDWLNNQPFKKLPSSRRSMCESPWINQRSSLCPPRPISIPNGRRPRVTSITTWRWTANTTRSPTKGWTKSWTSATRSARWDASIRADGWPATVVSWGKAASPPWPRICPAPIRSTPNGPPKEPPTGYTRSAKPRPS
ncbi:hypothetical protein DFAR_2760010 [Desulfarculales bacterium]